MLLKSCAMPPARCPTACIFSAWRSCAARRCALLLGPHLLRDVLHEADDAPRAPAVRRPVADAVGVHARRVVYSPSSRAEAVLERRCAESSPDEQHAGAAPSGGCGRRDARAPPTSRSVEMLVAARVPSTARVSPSQSTPPVAGIQLVEQVAARADHRLVAVAPGLGLARRLLALHQRARAAKSVVTTMVAR